MSAYANYWGSQKIEDVENYYIGQTPSEIITVKSTDTVEEVLKVLKDKNILSVPVIDEKQPEGKNGTPYVAVVNLIDLITAFAFQPIFHTYDTDSKIGELKEDTLSQVTEQQKKVLKSPVGDFSGISLESKRIWTFSEKDPLSKLMDAFSVGVHRVLISHGTRPKPYWTYVSQTDVLVYLKVSSYRRESKIHEVFLQSLSSLKLGGAIDSKDFTISNTQSAITGFRALITRNELSALPVVDGSGKLIETLSASDFRYVGLDNLKDTLLPVGEFLSKLRTSQAEKFYGCWFLIGGQYKQSVVVATVDEALYSVVDKLLLTGFHRVWVVDGDKKPIGVVSLTDIIKTFSVYAPTS